MVDDHQDVMKILCGNDMTSRQMWYLGVLEIRCLETDHQLSIIPMLNKRQGVTDNNDDRLW